MKRAPEWTEAEIAIAKPLWVKGVSVSKISAALKKAGHDRSRNAVIGWVSRNLGRSDMPKRNSPDAPRFRKSDDPQDGPSAERKAGLGKVWIKAPRLLPGQTPETGFPITDIPAGGCKYALTAASPHRFCGRPGTPYCPDHLKGLYQPATAPGNPHARKAAKDAPR